MAGVGWEWWVEGQWLQMGRMIKGKKSSTLLDLCVSSLRRGHANLLCIVPILTDVPRKDSSGFLGKAPFSGLSYS